MINEGNIEFDRLKIYEKLEFLPKPPGYTSRVPWKIQNQIAATNGRHYEDRIGKLTIEPLFGGHRPRFNKKWLHQTRVSQ